MTVVAVLERHPTSEAAVKAAPVLFEQLDKALQGPNADAIAKKMKGIVVFKIDDEEWTLDLREGETPSAYKGSPKQGKADLTLTITDENFAKLVLGKLNPQQAFLTRKLKINGSMALAMKLQPVLEAAKPQAKL